MSSLSHRRIAIEALGKCATSRDARLWRSLEELVEDDASRRALFDEMPQLASLAPALDRRAFVKLLGAALAMAGLAACKGPPAEVIVPWRRQPDGMPDDAPEFYATTLDCAGEIAGVLVETHQGRPTKIEGNPGHPASRGATDARMQAAVLELWDPDRSKIPTHRGTAASWSDFDNAIAAMRARIGERGRGLRVLSGRIASPTLERQRAMLEAKYPECRWHAHEPVDDTLASAAIHAEHGVLATPLYRFDRAMRIVALDADFLDAMPGHLRHARDFASLRAPDGEGAGDSTRDASRLYAAEPAPTLTGAMADHRFALSFAEIEAFAETLAASLGVEGAVPRSGTTASDHVDAIARDLREHGAASLVLAGPAQSARVHALAQRMNAVLGAVGHTIELVASDEMSAPGDIRALADAIRQGDVDTLVILDGNPVYATPAALGFEALVRKVPHSIHLGLHADETAGACVWHVPRAHALEAWSDLRAADGTASLVQPVIAPLHDGRSAHELIAAMLGETVRDAHAIVRETWRARAKAPDFEAFWRTSLANGVLDGQQSPRLARAGDAGNAPLPAAQSPGESAIELIFRPDASVWDGRFANNAWLQELPRPLTQLAWTNAALVAPELAERLDLRNGDVVELEAAGDRIEAPVWIEPGIAPRTVALALGYGRTRAGRVGDRVGVDAYRLRDIDSPWRREVALRKTDARMELASTQTHQRMDGRAPVRAGTLDEYRRDAGFASRDAETPPTLYAPAAKEPYAWGMTIDLNACIGCKACTIACQAENNIPTVGAEEVRRGREMHWLRVDRYYEGDPAAPSTFHQPVPCMHCEHAPCELVCPVGATVHDADGLNVQVYNRCIGTRFCSNNCPYKVRRFNFLQYADLGAESLKAQRNPDVTVRNRGVMEKCTYCVQRIERAHVAADRDGREIRDGEVLTACQAVCPTRAISFGNLADAASEVSRRKASPRNYALLAELNVRPRTSYLAKIVNPNPAIGSAT